MASPSSPTSSTKGIGRSTRPLLPGDHRTLPLRQSITIGPLLHGFDPQRAGNSACLTKEPIMPSLRPSYIYAKKTRGNSQKSPTLGCADYALTRRG